MPEAKEHRWKLVRTLLYGIVDGMLDVSFIAEHVVWTATKLGGTKKLRMKEQVNFIAFVHSTLQSMAGVAGAEVTFEYICTFLQKYCKSAATRAKNTNARRATGRTCYGPRKRKAPADPVDPDGPDNPVDPVDQAELAVGNPAAVAAEEDYTAESSGSEASSSGSVDSDDERVPSGRGPRPSGYSKRVDRSLF